MAAPWMCALVTLPSMYETNCVVDHQVLQEENKAGKEEDQEYSYQEGKKERRNWCCQWEEHLLHNNKWTRHFRQWSMWSSWNLKTKRKWMEEPKRQSLRFVATVETSLIKHSSRVNLSVASCNNWALVERHACWKYAWVNNLWVLFVVTMVILWGSIKQQNGKGGCHIHNRCGRPKYVCLGCHFLGHTQCPS